MSKRNILIFLVMVVALVAILYSTDSGESDDNYVEVVLEAREAQEEFMKSSPESPFAGMEESFQGLNYFPPDEKFRIRARLDRIERPGVVTLATNDGLEERYLEYGYAAFDFNQEEHRLLILEITAEGPSRGTLFLAFGDATSAISTYGAGRYLDLKKVPAATSITLDFNHAYNPYCAYNDTYSCPLPPRENLLPFAVEAGEKIYHNEK